MKLKKISGYELEKELPNTSEDFFNRSSVTFEDAGEEKTFHLLYVRFFEENMKETTPFNENPIFSVGDKEISLTDIVALVALLKDHNNKERKRLYINEEQEFQQLFANVDKEEVLQIVTEIEQKGSYNVK
jgi:hypothetical protein